MAAAATTKVVGDEDYGDNDGNAAVAEAFSVVLDWTRWYTLDNGSSNTMVMVVTVLGSRMRSKQVLSLLLLLLLLPYDR